MTHALSLSYTKKVFDVICGTSTGGILAMLFAAEKQSLASVTAMYDSLVVKIFTKDLLANAKLVLWQVGRGKRRQCRRRPIVHHVSGTPRACL